MKTTLKYAAAALFGAGMLALTASTASAAIACNAAGECWHVRGRAYFPASAGVVIHPDTWRWGTGAHFVWREPVRAGRGYWRNGIWIRF